MSIDSNERYSRQVLFPGIGAAGTGAAARFSRRHRWLRGYRFRPPPHFWLAPGIGELVIIDRDYVEPSNLQRQSLFGRVRCF